MVKVNSDFCMARNVMFIVYLDDCGKAYKYNHLLTYLGCLDVKCACSPIHDQDNHCKKSHVHCMICSDRPHSAEWFYCLMRPFGVTYFKKVYVVKSCLDYFEMRVISNA